MRRTSNLLCGIVLTPIVAALIGGVALAQDKSAKEVVNAAAEKMAPKPKRAVLWAADELKWKDNPKINGGKTAVLWGDPEKGAYGALEKWPAGTDTPLHIHTHDVKGVMLSGTLVITLEGKPPKELGPGSYVMIPGGVKHTTTCKAAAECLFLHEQPGRGDMKVVAGKAAKK